MAPVSVVPSRIEMAGKEVAVIEVHGPRRDIGFFVANHEFSTPVVLFVTPETPGAGQMSAPTRGPKPPTPRAVSLRSTVTSPTASESPTPEQVFSYLSDRVSSGSSVMFDEIRRQFLPSEFDRHAGPESARAYHHLVNLFRTARRRMERENRGHWAKIGATYGPHTEWQFVREG